MRLVVREVMQPSMVWEPHSDFAKHWTTTFVVSMLVAFAIDPLYFFVVSVNKV